MGIIDRINSNPERQSDDDNNNNGSMVQIPGIFELTGKGGIPPSLLLLVGLAASGKSMYCKQFFIDGVLRGDLCIYISPGMTEKKFRSLFPTVESETLDMTSKFINPYMLRDTKNNKGNTDDSDKLKLTLSELHEILVAQKRENEQDSNNSTNSLENDDHKESSSISYKVPSSSSPNGKNKAIRVVVDSLTQLFVLFGESAVLKFVGELSLLLKEFEATAIFTLTASLTSPNSLTNAVSSMLDGILEMRLDEGEDASLVRNIRVVSMNGIPHKPTWIQF
ncbi:MAG: RAD55 family ATPase, partial [Thermoproteota archaeon]|nr:RAD55 family ATPase [Thermoproteota archaeon]